MPARHVVTAPVLPPGHGAWPGCYSAGLPHRARNQLALASSKAADRKPSLYGANPTQREKRHSADLAAIDSDHRAWSANVGSCACNRSIWLVLYGAVCARWRAAVALKCLICISTGCVHCGGPCRPVARLVRTMPQPSCRHGRRRSRSPMAAWGVLDPGRQSADDGVEGAPLAARGDHQLGEEPDGSAGRTSGKRLTGASPGAGTARAEDFCNAARQSMVTC